MSDRADLIEGVLQREHPTALGDVTEVEQVDPSGAYAPPTSGGYTARAQVSVGIGTTDAAATFVTA